MKKIIFCLLALTFCLSAQTSSAAVFPFGKSVEHSPNSMSDVQKQERMSEITRRVEEIRSMDKSHLSREEKRGLKRELKGMEREARAITHGGVYLSAGAILIIILVLILIL